MKRICPAIVSIGMLTLLFMLVSVACNQTNTPIYVTATPDSLVQLVPDNGNNSLLPTLPNPFKPTPTPFGPTATALVVTPNPTFIPATTTITYTVVAGDTLGGLAQRYGTSVEVLTQLNPGVNTASLLNAGQALTLPGRPDLMTPDIKLIPDSELVYSPGTVGFDIAAYIKFQPGFIRVYSEDVYGRLMNSADIIKFVAMNTSINPRLLLALMEYRGGWITNPIPDTAQINYPLGLVDSTVCNKQQLFAQLNCAANLLNAGYYGFKQRGLTYLEFTNQHRVAFAPSLNPGTAAVQTFLALSTTSQAVWERDVSREGFFTTYMAMFGDPFRYAIDPLVPPNLRQPDFTLPFGSGEIWYITSGPHGGWDPTGSGWGAIDFAPPTPPDQLLAEQGSCYISPAYVTAMVSGLVVRSTDGAVVIDVDRDGDERTGWTILYLHIAEQDRIAAGSLVEPGTAIGHASCEGFYLNSKATHVHIARRYNGEWIAADCWACAPQAAEPAFVLGGWTLKGYPNQAYQGWLEKDGQVRRAEQGRDDPINQISW